MKMDQIQRFLWDETGSATIEFVLWVPLFAFLLAFTASISFVYLDAARMENAARDGARRISMGQDTAAVTTAMAQQLPDLGYNIDASCTTTEVACISITRPSENVLPFVNFSGVSSLLGENFGAEVRMRREPGSV